MKVATDENGNITISKEQYLEYLERDYTLRWLEEFGVDNWEGFDFISEMPDFQDFDGTLEEYSVAWQKAIDGVW